MDGDFPACSGVARWIMKSKSKTKRGQKKQPAAARETTPASPVRGSFQVVAMEEQQQRIVRQNGLRRSWDNHIVIGSVPVKPRHQK